MLLHVGRISLTSGAASVLVGSSSACLMVNKDAKLALGKDHTSGGTSLLSTGVGSASTGAGSAYANVSNGQAEP